MIRYRRLYESKGSDIKLYDVVNCAGYDWHVIDIDGDIVTLLAKDNDFGKSIFDEESNDYETSEIRKYINNIVLPKLQNANPIPTKLRDVKVTDKVWLLSTDEAEELPTNIRKFPRWWWLRSPGYYRYSAAYVYIDASVNSSGCNIDNDSGCVRPAMRVRTEDLEG